MHTPLGTTLLSNPPPTSITDRDSPSPPLLISSEVGSWTYQLTKSSHLVHQSSVIKALERTHHLKTKCKLLEKYSSAEPQYSASETNN
ncbi:hypothetical protein HMI55_006417 [Coelomomyces lativittatus]|nr:hypothetical protein HMI55_006417 [Coelomomyces lativittatus]